MPNRIIKESICTSEDIASLSQGAEILFYRLIVKADDYGCYYGNEKIIKNTCYPLKSDDIKLDQMKQWVSELVKAGLIYHYEAEDGKRYIQFVKWSKHQQIRAKKSKFPQFTESCHQLISNDCKCPRNPIQSNPIQTQSEYVQRAPAREEHPQDNGFETLWDAYPRKAGDIQRAATEYLIAIDGGAKLEDMLLAIEWQKTQDTWTDQGGRFIPSLEKWLHNRGWTQRKPEEKKEQPKEYSGGDFFDGWDLE